MNDPQLRKFYSRLSEPLPAFGTRMEAVVYNPSTHSGRGGIRVLQQVVPYRRSLLEMRVEEEGGKVSLRVDSKNVLRLSLCREFSRWMVRGGERRRKGRRGEERWNGQGGVGRKETASESECHQRNASSIRLVLDGQEIGEEVVSRSVSSGSEEGADELWLVPQDDEGGGGGGCGRMSDVDESVEGAEDVEVGNVGRLDET